MSGIKQPDELWGLLPGWEEWFAWRPVKACGRWRWLSYVQRRRVAEDTGIQHSYVQEEWPWEYTAGRAHDYPDSTIGAPLHFHTLECKHCGARFGI